MNMIKVFFGVILVTIVEIKYRTILSLHLFQPVTDIIKKLHFFLVDYVKCSQKLKKALKTRNFIYMLINFANFKSLSKCNRKSKKISFTVFLSVACKFNANNALKKSLKRYSTKVKLKSILVHFKCLSNAS